MRWIVALALALAAGLGSLYGLTDGFAVLTAEDARRQDVAQHPRAIPATAVLAEDGRVLDLRQDLRRDGRVADCAITASSGHDLLDATACARIASRARFAVATDANGAATTGIYLGSIRWELDE